MAEEKKYDPKIYSAISAIMAECPAIGKNQKNLKQNFMYRGIDIVMNVFQPLLSKHGVFAVPEVLEHRREERQSASGGNLIYSVLKIKYTFYADDGSNVSVTVIGEGMDSGDKASNKAMSVAFKYACFQLFCIPTEEMKDPDGETPPPSKPVTPDVRYRCAVCKTPFVDVVDSKGIKHTAKEIHDAWAQHNLDGVARCKACTEAARSIPNTFNSDDNLGDENGWRNISQND